MFAGHYTDWIKTRINGIEKHLGKGFFNGKKVLEVGCGYGHIGNVLSGWGADVVCSDARQEYMDKIRDIYPHLGVVRKDLDKPLALGNERYDVVIHFGVLYHITKVREHLLDIAKYCDVMVLETEVCDSFDIDYVMPRSESGYDQAFNAKAVRVPAVYIEKCLEEAGFEYKMIRDLILNSGGHTYDWKEKNDKSWHDGKRRFWVCWKKGLECPLL